MATGQDLLDTMEDLDQELENQSGEADVARSLRALNRAQDLWETLLSDVPSAFGDTSGTVATAANTETTAFPTGVLRIDRMQYIDPGTSRPAWDLRSNGYAGSHAFSNYWPWNIISTVTSGKPRRFWTNGRLIYWDPFPDGIHTVRWYGLQSASNITAGGTFAYTDELILPISALAVRILATGVGDNSGDYISMAEETLGPVLRRHGRFVRDIPNSLLYVRDHES